MKGLSAPAFVSMKKDDTYSAFEKRVLNNFRQEFWPLKNLALHFRDILFYYNIDSKDGDYKLGTPAGEVARCDMYNRVINTFSECI